MLEIAVFESYAKSKFFAPAPLARFPAGPIIAHCSSSLGVRQEAAWASASRSPAGIATFTRRGCAPLCSSRRAPRSGLPSEERSCRHRTRSWCCDPSAHSRPRRRRRRVAGVSRPHPLGTRGAPPCLCPRVDTSTCAAGVGSRRPWMMTRENLPSSFSEAVETHDLPTVSMERDPSIRPPAMDELRLDASITVSNGGDGGSSWLTTSR